MVLPPVWPAGVRENEEATRTNEVALADFQLEVRGQYATKAESVANVSAAISGAISLVRTEIAVVTDRLSSEVAALAQSDNALCEAAYGHDIGIP